MVERVIRVRGDMDKLRIEYLVFLRMGESTAVEALASAETGAGDYARAEAAFLRVLEADKRAFGPTHPTTQKTLNQLAVVRTQAGEELGEQREDAAGDKRLVAYLSLTGQAGADPERDRQVRLAGAGRAEQDDVLAAGEEVELAEVLDDGLLDRWKVKSNSSSVLRAGKRAALMRAWPPWLSRLSVSVFSSVAANFS
mgnify:CR=1 FL=1